MAAADFVAYSAPPGCVTPNSVRFLAFPGWFQLLLQLLPHDHVVSPLKYHTPGFACTPRERNPMESSQVSEGGQVIRPPGVLRVACLQAPSLIFQRPWRVNKAFLDMGVLTKYDQIEPIYLPQCVITYIYLYPVYTYIHSQAF
jgi:hypothetical protein